MERMRESKRFGAKTGRAQARVHHARPEVTLRRRAWRRLPLWRRVGRWSRCCGTGRATARSCRNAATAATVVMGCPPAGGALVRHRSVRWLCVAVARGIGRLTGRARVPALDAPPLLLAELRAQLIEQLLRAVGELGLAGACRRRPCPSLEEIGPRESDALTPFVADDAKSTN